MCEACAEARLGAELAVLDLQVSVIAAEADAGLSWSGASRILTDLELRSGVRFSALDDLHARTAGLIARLTLDLQATALAALLDDLGDLGDVEAAAVLARLNALTDPTNPARLPVGQQAAAVAAQVTDALARAHVAAAGHMVAEARSQGVPEALLVDESKIRVTAEKRRLLAAQAQTLAGQPVTRVLTTASTAARAAARPGVRAGEVVAAAGDAVNKLKPNALEDQARQATTAAVNEGRREVLEQAPPPQQVQASELLDSNTCGPCAAVDGRIYESLDAALVDYPSGGTYEGCLGGPRCRGTLVAVWDSEALPTLLEPGDRPPGVHPIQTSPQGPSTGVPASGQARQVVGGGSGTGTPPSSGPGTPAAGTPQGTPVSHALNVTGGTKTQQAQFQRALDAIDAAHGDGVLPAIDLKAINSTGTLLGGYSYRGARAIGIEIKATGDWPALTVVHEIGHFIDHQALGNGALLGTEIGALDDVLDAIRGSDAIARLQAFDFTPWPSSEHPALVKHIAYLQEAPELFARAYAQWVTVVTGDRLLTHQLGQAVDYGIRTGLMRQWETDDFEPIAEAIEDFMRGRGWIA